MNQSKKYGIKNLKWIRFLKPLLAQSCQRRTNWGPHKDVTATIVRASWNFRTCPRRWEKIENILQQDTEILHVSCITWRRMRIWLAGKTHVSKWLESVWISKFSTTRAWQWFGRFFNIYMAGRFRQLFNLAFSQYLIWCCQNILIIF